MPRRPSHLRALAKRALGLAIPTILAGCIAYQPASLPKKPDLAASVAGLTLASPRYIPLPGLEPHRIDPRVGLDPTAAAILAVLNDPALEAQQAQRQIAAAQLFAAGLLPDPLINLSHLRPAAGGGSANNGSALSLQALVTSLLGRRDRIRSAQEHLNQIELDLLWRGWQVAQRARWLATAVVAERQSLTATDAAWTALGHPDKRAWDLSLGGSASAVELAELRSLSGQLAAEAGTARRRLSDDEQSLRALLRLAPGAELPLRSGPALVVKRGAVAAALADLPHRRPDLLALAAGFRSADQRLRAAVAAQFPAVSVSFLREHDVEGVTSIGLGVSLRLPLFNRGRGAVRLAQASRAALEKSYRARLDQAQGEVATLVQDYAVLRRESSRMPRQPSLDSELSRIVRLERQGSVSHIEALRLALSSLQAQQRRIATGLELDKVTIALETVLGVPPEELR